MPETNNNADQTRRFVIRPNGAMNAKASIAFFTSLAFLSFAIAGVFFVLGMWPILPFAGLEMAFLASVLYLCHRRGKRREVVTISGDTVVISRGSTRPERVCFFRRAWAQVCIESSPFRGHPQRLLIGSHGRRVEVGSYLSEPEKTALADRLREAIHPRAAPACCK